MSNAEIGFTLLSIGVLAVMLTAVVVWRVDSRTSPSRVLESVQPFPGRAQAAVLKAVIPGTVGAFVFGFVAFGRAWAGFGLAAMTVTYGLLLPRWLWHHSQQRRLRAMH